MAEFCFACHGPEEGRKAGLRLDIRDGVTRAASSGRPVIDPSNPDNSELIARIVSAGPDVMPPKRFGKQPSATQVEVLRRWIKDGAAYTSHWAYSRPVSPEVPRPAANPDWVRNPIDAFILARLEREGLSPAVEANRATLVRRLSLDLTGLPPGPAEVDAFAADHSPEAYEQLVDRLLASPHYGERMAVEWLDLARRGVYVFVKRTMPHPSLALFDAPNRDVCAVRRHTSNTSLQARALLNDTTSVECARGAAERMARDGGATTDDRLVYGFRLCTARRPRPDELDILRRVHAAELARFERDPRAVAALLRVGESPIPKDLEGPSLAALTVVANLLLNLDETITLE